MLRESRRLDAPELDAIHDAVELRASCLRIGTHAGRNVASDFGVVDRALPFVHRMSRSCLTLVFEGEGRFDEGGRRVRIAPGELVLSDQRRGGTEAYAGTRTRYLVMEWDPAIVGAAHAAPLEVVRLGRADLARLSSAATSLAGPCGADACAEVVRVLRSAGFGFERIDASFFAQSPPEAEQRLATAIGAQLSNLRAHPAIDDVATELGWNARLVHRRLAASAARYGLPWEHWRAMLHHVRLISALRLLAAPGATTETVARLTGFRAPTALCHAFEDAGLPSPGTFVRDARRGALEGWADHAAGTVRAA